MPARAWGFKSPLRHQEDMHGPFRGPLVMSGHRSPLSPDAATTLRQTRTPGGPQRPRGACGRPARTADDRPHQRAPPTRRRRPRPAGLGVATPVARELSRREPFAHSVVSGVAPAAGQTGRRWRCRLGSPAWPAEPRHVTPPLTWRSAGGATPGSPRRATRTRRLAGGRRRPRRGRRPPGGPSR